MTTSAPAPASPSAIAPHSSPVPPMTTATLPFNEKSEVRNSAVGCSATNTVFYPRRKNFRLPQNVIAYGKRNNRVRPRIMRSVRSVAVAIVFFVLGAAFQRFYDSRFLRTESPPTTTVTEPPSVPEKPAIQFEREPL